MRKHLTTQPGTVYGRLTVIEETDPYFTPQNKPVKRFNCKCICGSIVKVYGYSLRNGHTSSCGCYNKAVITTHGHTKTRTYKTWCSMRERCSNPNSPDYFRYGERGIKVCPEWEQSYDQFLLDMGERPDSMSLDRIDVNKGYSPQNCKWSTPHEQSRNMRSNFNIEIDGQVKCLMDWCTQYGLERHNYFYVWARIRKGWDPKEALTTPKYEKRRSSDSK